MSKSIKVALFSPNTPKSKVLTSNGEYILDDICLDICSDEELASTNYDFEAVFLVDKAEKYKHIVEEAILKVKEQYGDEIFKICKVTKDMNEIRVYGRQNTIDSSLGCWLPDVRPTSLNGQASLEYMLRNTNEYKSNEQYAKDLEVFSDITKLNTAYYQDMTLYQALHDTDQSFKNRWGGEVQRRGYRININNRIGANRGFQVRSNKNLLGFESETNIDSVVTRIKPKGFDGITIDGYVDSPLINNYSRIYTREIKYEDIKVKGENDDEGYDTLAEAQAELIRRAKAEFTENHIDEIQATYTISFLDLSKTEEYKDYAILERCYIGDTVNVYEEKLGININVRVNRIKYNILKQEVIEIELTNSDLSKYKVPSIFDIKNQLDKIPSSDSILIEAKKNATDLINAGLKDSYVITRKNEILIMDTQDINTAKNVWRWNNGGLGFSSTGYYGEFGTAITRDGKIVADFITTGVLNANLIKTGILSSFNGKSSINMGNGTFNFGNKLIYDGDTVSLDGTFETHNSNGSNAIKIEKVKMHFYEWNTSGRSVGTIYSGEDTSNSAIKSMNMSNSMTAYLMLGYEISNGSKNSYIVLDKYDKIGRYDVPINMTEDTKVWGNFSVTGSKNSLQETKSYGERLINSYETAEYYFGDIGSGVINYSGECIVWIDDILQECINTSAEYHVFTQIYSGDITSVDRHRDYFVVYGDVGTEFSWELKAKRIGYENVRLDTVEINAVRDIPNSFTEEELTADTSEGILMEELDFELENILLNGGI